MRIVVDVGLLRNNLKKEIASKIFSWIDIRNNFYNFGLSLLEDIFKIDNIGIFTNQLNDAIRVRNVNRQIPIVLTKISNIDQIYDVIINNIILVISDYNQLESIIKLNLQDKLSIIIQLNIDNYEDGIKYNCYNKVYDFIRTHKEFNLVGIYTIVNDMNNDINKFISIVNEKPVRSFIIGFKHELVSDNFISKEIFNNSVRYELNVDKGYKLLKGDIFVNKKVKKDCYGIRIKADNIDLNLINRIVIDNIRFKTIKYNYNTLFMIGNAPIKSGKKIDITHLITNNCYTNWPVVYVLNGKILNLSIL